MVITRRTQTNVPNASMNQTNSRNELFYTNSLATISPADIVKIVSVLSPSGYEKKTRGINAKYIDTIDSEFPDYYYCSKSYNIKTSELNEINWQQTYNIVGGTIISKLTNSQYNETIFGKILEKTSKTATHKSNTINEVETTRVTRKMGRLSISNIPPPKNNYKPNSIPTPVNVIYLDNKIVKAQKYSKHNDSDSDYSSNYFSSDNYDSQDDYSSSESEFSDASDDDFIFSKQNRRLKQSSYSASKKNNLVSREKYANKFNLIAKNSYLDLRLPSRDSIQNSSEPQKNSKFESALANLHVSATPESLPCRENECMDIFGELYEALDTRTSCCLYVSGVPGTGKTATVYEVIKMIKMSCDSGDLPHFDFVEINGMKLTEPQQLYVQLWKSISGTQTKLTAAHAALMLNEFFSDSSAKKNSQPMKIVFVDELDVLVTKSQSIMYNLFDWPTRPKSNLIVITVANTMDLPERMLQHKISSRLGLKRINFMPYSHEQLTKIVTSRIGDSLVFEPDAVQLCARKIGAVSGDARRALDVCRRAVEIVQNET
ncbi:Origin recognition complex subunit 1, partial [Smittium culicis]